MLNSLLNKPQVLNQTIYEMLLQCNHQEKLCIFNSSYLIVKNRQMIMWA